MPEASKERLIRYLNDAHAAVQGEVAALQDVTSQSLDAAVTAASQQHLDTAKSHLALIEARIEALGGTRAAAKGLLNTIIAKGSNFVNAFHDDQDKQTQDLIKLFALEKFGVAMFTSLQAFAQAASDADTSRLAATLIADEAAAADQFEMLLPRLAVASANKTADVTVSTTD